MTEREEGTASLLALSRTPGTPRTTEGVKGLQRDSNAGTMSSALDISVDLGGLDLEDLPSVGALVGPGGSKDPTFVHNYKQAGGGVGLSVSAKVSAVDLVNLSEDNEGDRRRTSNANGGDDNVEDHLPGSTGAVESTRRRTLDAEDFHPAVQPSLWRTLTNLSTTSSTDGMQLLPSLGVGVGMTPSRSGYSAIRDDEGDDVYLGEEGLGDVEAGSRSSGARRKYEKLFDELGVPFIEGQGLGQGQGGREQLQERERGAGGAGVAAHSQSAKTKLSKGGLSRMKPSMVAKYVRTRRYSIDESSSQANLASSRPGSQPGSGSLKEGKRARAKTAMNQ